MRVHRKYRDALPESLKSGRLNLSIARHRRRWFIIDPLSRVAGGFCTREETDLTYTSHVQLTSKVYTRHATRTNEIASYSFHRVPSIQSAPPQQARFSKTYNISSVKCIQTECFKFGFCVNHDDNWKARLSDKSFVTVYHRVCVITVLDTSRQRVTIFIYKKNNWTILAQISKKKIFLIVSL